MAEAYWPAGYVPCPLLRWRSPFYAEVYDPCGAREEGARHAMSLPRYRHVQSLVFRPVFLQHAGTSFPTYLITLTLAQFAVRTLTHSHSVHLFASRATI